MTVEKILDLVNKERKTLYLCSDEFPELNKDIEFYYDSELKHYKFDIVIDEDAFSNAYFNCDFSQIFPNYTAYFDDCQEGEIVIGYCLSKSADENEGGFDIITFMERFLTKEWIIKY